MCGIKQQTFLPTDCFRQLYDNAEELARMLSGLKGKLVSS